MVEFSNCDRCPSIQQSKRNLAIVRQVMAGTTRLAYGGLHGWPGRANHRNASGLFCFIFFLFCFSSFPFRPVVFPSSLSEKGKVHNHFPLIRDYRPAAISSSPLWLHLATVIAVGCLGPGDCRRRPHQPHCGFRLKMRSNVKRWTRGEDGGVVKTSPLLSIREEGRGSYLEPWARVGTLDGSLQFVPCSVQDTANPRY